VIPTWYIEWAARHAKKFNYNDAGRDAILSCADEFASIYTTEELHRATAALVLDPQCPRGSDRAPLATTTRYVRSWIRKCYSRQGGSQSGEDVPLKVYSAVKGRTSSASGSLCPI
jgi:hypothetical protein